MSLVSWDVTLPRRGAAAPGRAKPRAILTIQTDEGDEERTLPLAVGKALLAKQDDPSFDPASCAELLHAVRQIQLNRAHERVVGLVDKRDYAREELCKKLLLDGYSHSVIDEVLTRACDAGLVDDMRYARVYIRSKLAQGWGSARIVRELSIRGISADDVEGWPEDFLDGQTEFDRALEVARTKRATGKDPVAKIARFLCGRGFSQSVAFSAAKQVIEERMEED